MCLSPQQQTMKAKQGKGDKPTPKEVTVMPNSFVAMALHSIRHPHATVHGILLGTADKNTFTITVLDAVPICHGAPTMPIVETALGLIEVMLKKQNVTNPVTDEKSTIVGWYTAPMLLDDKRPGPPALRMAANLASAEANEDDDCNNVMDPILLVLHNKPITERIQLNSKATTNEQLLQCYGRDFGNQWLDPIKTKIINNGGESLAVSTLERALEQGILVNDLVDHLDGSTSTTWFPNTDVMDLFS